MIIGTMSSLLAPTLREFPSDAEFPSHRLLIRAGFMRPVGAGIYSLLPLGTRTVKKIEAILRDEMNRVGGQEVLLPVTQPAELWKESGRWDEIGDEMARFCDRSGRDMCLAMTHEESIVQLARGDVKSYRQLPLLLYQIQTKFRDEPRPRGGLIRVREFTMKDAYSFHADEASLEEWYRKLYAAYERIFRRAGLEFLVVESDPGMMGGKVAHEFIAPSPCGEDTIIRCSKCGYSANRQVARFRRDDETAEAPEPLAEVATPGRRTIAEVAEFLGIHESRTAKAVFFHSASRGLVFAVLRGDHEINETQLAAALGASDLRPAHEEEIAASGAVAGYASPVGVRNSHVIADTQLLTSRNLVSGANREGFHMRNVNMGRDFDPDAVAEIAAAAAGRPCAACGGPLEEVRGIEVGNIFKLGTRYSASMHAVFQDAAGVDRPFIMGCYGIGSGRLMASVVEQRHDDDGIIWPPAIAPFHAVIVMIAEDAPDQKRLLLEAAEASPLEIILDDRDLRAGVKFKDADLIGVPLRITFGKKAKDGVVEVRFRGQKESRDVAIAELAAIFGAFAGDLAG